MKRKLCIIFLFLFISSIALVPSASAEPVSPSATIGNWNLTNDTNFDAAFPDYSGEITSMQYFENKLWAFGTDSYSRPVFLRYDGDQWAEQAPTTGLDGQTTTVSASAVSNGNLIVATSGSHQDSAQLWVYSQANGWLFDNHLPAMHYITNIAVHGTDICIAANRSVDSDTTFCDFGSGWVEYPLDFTDPIHEYARSSIVFAGATPYLIVGQGASPYSGIYTLVNDEWTLVSNTGLTDSSTKWVGLTSTDDTESPLYGLLFAVKQNLETQQVSIYVLTQDGNSFNQISDTNFGQTGDFSDVKSVKMVNDSLFVALNHDGEGQIWGAPISEGDLNWQLLNDEQDFDNIDEGPAPTVNDILIVGPTMLAATSYPSEGSYFPAVWQLLPSDPEEETTTTPTTATTTPITIPSGSDVPNNGDANGDGILDADQQNVVTFQNGATTSGNLQWASLEVSNGCIGDLSMKKEAQLAKQDASFEYPAGLINFEVGCLTNGQTITVSQYFYGLSQNASSFVARKYTGYNNQYQTLDGASVKDVTIGGQHVIKVTYSLSDGGKLDDDQLANGSIKDPAGVGILAGALPATGTNTQTILLISVFVLLTGLFLFQISCRLKRKRF